MRTCASIVIQSRCCAVVLPIRLSDVDPEAKLKALKQDPVFASSSKGFAQSGGSAPPSKPTLEGDARWMLTAHNVDEWAQWLQSQKNERGNQADNFYIQVRLCTWSW
jgi:hypothetical protein